MNDAFGLDDYERKLCSGSEAPFFSACIDSFGFLVTEHGYRVSFHAMGQGCYQARFTQETETEYFYLRLFHEFDHLWCEIERFAGLDHQRRIRFGEAVQVLGLPFSTEHLDVALPNEQAIPLRVRAFADCVREHLKDFRNIPIHPIKT
jgi:hypothetical protein